MRIPFIQLDVVSSCNLECRHCVLATHYPESEPISPQTVSAIVAAPTKLGVVWLSCNAEPLMDVQLPFIISRLADSGAEEIGLTTNGVLLNFELLNQLIDTGLTSLSISVDDLTGGFEPLRPIKPALLTQKLNLLKHMHETRGLKLSVISVLSKTSWESFPETAQFLFSLPLEHLEINFLEAYKPELRNEVLSGQLYDSATEMCSQLSLEAEKKGISVNFPKRRPDDSPCPYLAPTISPGGKVSPCSPYSYARTIYLPDEEIRRSALFLGDLRRQTLTEILESQKWREFSEQVTEGPAMKRCGRCPLLMGLVCP